MLKPFSIIIPLVLITSLLSCSQVQDKSLNTIAVSSTVNINQAWQFKRVDSETKQPPSKDGGLKPAD